MLKYIVTRRKPFGTEYHGPGSTKSKWHLSLYHLTNRIAAWIKAKRQGHKRMDIDVMHSLDDVPVVNHSLDAMGKEGFRDRVGKKDVPWRTINNLTWSQIKQLRTPDGTPISHVRWHFQEAKRRDMIAAVDLKGYWSQWRIDQLIRIANEENVWMYVKCDPKKTHLRWALNKFRRQGVWGRYNGTGVFLKPLD